jgi:hypothetical protein
MISILAAALAVIASHTTPAVASSFVSNLPIGDHIVKRTLDEGVDDEFSSDDDLLLSIECLTESVSLPVLVDDTDYNSCKDAGGKVFEIEYNCPAIYGDAIVVIPMCVGMSCTVEEYQALFDDEVFVEGGCSSVKVSSSTEDSSPEDSSPEEGAGDDVFIFQYLSFKCLSESNSVQGRFNTEVLAGNLSYSCKDAGGKEFKFEFEGTCRAYDSSIDEDEFSSGDSDCVGTSCTVKEFQATFDALVAADQSSGSFYEGCSNFKVSSSAEESSGAFSLGTAGCVMMASLLLSTAALLN